MPDRAVQGNLDPAALLCPWDVVEREADDVLARAGGRPGHVFNLGHGVLPDTDPDVLDAARRARARADRGEGGGVNPAVILMAYGSPDRLADVPAYYADIRGGRPIAPEHLDDLVARYRALGVGDGEEPSPLNEITEETRAALEAALGLPVLTGMRHWQPRIADAVEAALAGGADLLVGLVLAPHFSSLSIAKYRELFDEAVAGRAESRFVERWGADPAFVDAARATLRVALARHDAHVVFTAHSLPARILDEGDPYRDELLETASLVAERAGVERLVVLLPERVADRRALARARHPRPPRGAHGTRRRRRARVPDRVRLRPPRDPLGHRPRGAASGPRSSAAARADRDAERRRGFVEALAGVVRRGCSRVRLGEPATPVSVRRRGPVAVAELRARIGADATPGAIVVDGVSRGSACTVARRGR